MFVDVQLVGGSNFSIRIDSIIRLRPTHGTTEPMDATMVEIAERTICSSEPAVVIVERIAHSTPMARLTTPVGVRVYISANKVTDIANADSMLHHESAQAVVTVAGQQQQVTETRDHAREVIQAALGMDV